MPPQSNDKQACRCDPLGVVAEDRLPPLRWGLLCLAIKSAVNHFGELGISIGYAYGSCSSKW